MKKIISAAIVCVFICTMALSALAAASPSAPIIPDESSTKEPTTVQPTQEPSEESSKPTQPGGPTQPGDTTKPGETTKPGDTTKPGATTKPAETTDKGDVDDITTTPDDATSTTKNDVTSDKKPVSPDTGSYVGKSASAAALVALTLGGAAVYTSKKKVTE